jgi:hypothetical protein
LGYFWGVSWGLFNLPTNVLIAGNNHYLKEKFVFLLKSIGVEILLEAWGAGSDSKSNSPQIVKNKLIK